MTVLEMKYGQMDGVGKPISRLVQGTMMVGTGDKDFAYGLLDGVMEEGVNCFDSGAVYSGGGSERALGDWMQDRGNREEVVILTKGCHHNQDRKCVTPYDLSADLHNSLARLKTDYIDLYLLHRDDPSVPVGPIVEQLNQHQREGKIKVFGGSNWTPQRLAEANAYAEANGLNGFSVSSPNFSLAEQVESPWGDDCVSISGEAHAEDRAWYAEQKMPVMVWSSLARGFFSGKWNRENYQGMAGTTDDSTIRAYCHETNWQRMDRVKELAEAKGCTIPQIAMAWVLAQQSLDLYALVGCYKVEELVQCRDAMSLGLSEAECAYLNLERESLP